MGGGYEGVGDDVTCGLEPVVGGLVEDLAFEGDGGEYAVKGGLAVGCDDDEVGAKVVYVAYFALWCGVYNIIKF